MGFITLVLRLLVPVTETRSDCIPLLQMSFIFSVICFSMNFLVLPSCELGVACNNSEAKYSIRLNNLFDVLQSMLCRASYGLSDF